MKLQKLYSYTRKAIDDFQMIKENDSIAVGISGGKDSLTLLYALAGLRRFYPVHYSLTAITVDLKSQHKQLLNTFKQFINIWNNPEQHHQKPRQAYQKCLFIPSTVFQDLAENRNQNPYCSDFKNKTYLHSLSFPASAAKYSKTVIYTVKKQIINTCSPKKHSHKYSAQYSHTAV